MASDAADALANTYPRNKELLSLGSITSVIQIGESCIAIFAEVTLPYTFTYENYSFGNVQ